MLGSQALRPADPETPHSHKPALTLGLEEEQVGELRQAGHAWGKGRTAGGGDPVLTLIKVPPPGPQSHCREAQRRHEILTKSLGPLVLKATTS